MTPVTAVKTEPDPEPLGLDSLTAAETALAERKAAQSVTTLGNEAYPQANILGALGWVLFRRSDPRMTFEAYMGSRRLGDITRELGLANDDTDGDDEAELGKDDATTSPT